VRVLTWEGVNELSVQQVSDPVIQNPGDMILKVARTNCRKGGSVFILGVLAGLADTFPLGALMNKGLTLRGAQQHGHRYIPMLLERMAAGELVTEHLATHTMPLVDGPRGYQLFKDKEDGNIRTVFVP
jgi:threonine dehydrogenase-like Zn-dependent dehydrogenase